MAKKAACLPGQFNIQGCSADKPLNSRKLTKVFSIEERRKYRTEKDQIDYMTWARIKSISVSLWFLAMATQIQGYIDENINERECNQTLRYRSTNSKMPH